MRRTEDGGRKRKSRRMKEDRGWRRRSRRMEEEDWLQDRLAMMRSGHWWSPWRRKFLFDWPNTVVAP
jgi:hypothetical protein